jgi:hypothetical protein
LAVDWREVMPIVEEAYRVQRDRPRSAVPGAANNTVLNGVKPFARGNRERRAES